MTWWEITDAKEATMHPVDELTEKLITIIDRAERREGRFEPWELNNLVMEAWLCGITEAGAWLRDNWRDLREVTAEPGRVLAEEMVHEASGGRLGGVPVRAADED